MDDQGLAWRRAGRLFQQVPWAERDLVDTSWFTFGEAYVGKADFKKMAKMLAQGAWTLWRLLPPARGVAVSYPYEGRLFVYYLHGERLFGNVSSEDLLDVARKEGLSGVLAEVHAPATKRILSSLGFDTLEAEPPGWWKMELKDGQST